MTYKHLKLWQRPDSYAGPEWTGYYFVIGQHRDSDSISRSNWIIANQKLDDMADSLGDRMIDDEGDSFLQVVRDSHWAVGWIEFVYLHKHAPLEILDLAEAMLADLDDYPVLDDDHLSNLEEEEAQAYWAGMCVRDRAVVIIESKSGASLFAARRDWIPPDDDGRLHDYLRGS